MLRKTNVWIFKATNKRNLKKNNNKKCGHGNLKRECEFLLIAAQNNAIRTNYVQARIDKTQQNRWIKLSGDRDETVNHIISECSKFAQREYMTRHDWVEKLIPRELCNTFKFDNSNK